MKNISEKLEKINKGKYLGSYNAKVTRYPKRLIEKYDAVTGQDLSDMFNEVEIIIYSEKKDKYTNLQGKLLNDRNRKGSCTDMEKIKESQYLNGLRAKSRIRKLIKANFMYYHWVTTYQDDVTDREKALNDVKNFIKRLSYQQGKKIKYVAVPEIQEKRFKKTGKKVIHMHIAISEEIEIKAFWGAWNDKKCLTCEKYSNKKKFFQCGSCPLFKGVVYVKKGQSYDVDKIANYFSKYFTKTFDDDNQRDFNQKRYLCSKGLIYPSEENNNINKKQEKVIKEIVKGSGAFYCKEIETDNCHKIKTFIKISGGIYDDVMKGIYYGYDKKN